MNVSLCQSVRDLTPTITPLADIAERIRSDEFSVSTEYLRSELDKKKRQLYKADHLPAFIASGEFRTREGKVSLTDKWASDSGLIVLDYLDDNLDIAEAITFRDTVSYLPWVVLAFISPSGGVKVAVKMEKVDTTSDREHKARWAHAARMIHEITEKEANLDESGKDPTRLCFLSHDPDLHFNPDAETLPSPTPESSLSIPNQPSASKDNSINHLLTAKANQIDAYLSRIYSIEGRKGSEGLMQVCRSIVDGFAIDDPTEQWNRLKAWNQSGNAQPPWSDKELKHALDNVRKTPPTKDRGRLNRTDNSFEYSTCSMHPSTGNQIPPETKKLALTCFTDTEERTPEWLWPSHLLRGATHVLGGKQGTSKGLFTVDIASRISRGEPMPDGTGGGEPAKVLIVTREDNPEDALKPRLRVAGARMENVSWTYGDFTDGQAIPSMREGAEAITQAVNEHGFEFVIIDPLGAWVEDDMNNGQAVRAVIDPMSKMARDTGCCVLFVAHLKKTPTDDLMDAFSGSHQVTASVRVALHIGPSTADGSRKILNVVKTNYKRPEEPMVYELWKDLDWHEDTPPKLAWGVATEEDRVNANSKRQEAPSVPHDLIMELMPDGHQKTKDASKMVQKALKSKDRAWNRITQASIETSFRELEAAGLLFFGTNLKGAEIVGKEPPPQAKSKKELACDEYLSDQTASIREIAKRVGCSNGQAQEGIKLAKTILNEEETDVA